MSRYSYIDPQDIDPATGRPYSNYSSGAIDTSFHDHEMDDGDDEAWRAFKIGDVVLWPNGVEGAVRGIDASDGTLLDHCGGWHAAADVERIA